MSKVNHQQTLNDIVQVLETAQRQDKAINVDDHGRVKLVSFFQSLRGNERSVRMGPDAAATAGSQGVASLRSAIEASVALPDHILESGEDNAYIRLNRAVHQLHASLGPNELPVQAYRELLSQFAILPAPKPLPQVDLSTITAHDFEGSSNTQPPSAALQSMSLAPAYGQVEGSTVKAALLSLGPDGHAIAHRLADVEHLTTSRLVTPDPADREPAMVQISQQLLGARESLSQSIRDAHASEETTLAEVLTHTWKAVDTQLTQLQQPLPALPEGATTTWSAAIQAHAVTSTQGPSSEHNPETTELEESAEFFDALDQIDTPPAKKPEAPLTTEVSTAHELEASEEFFDTTDEMFTPAPKTTVERLAGVPLKPAGTLVGDPTGTPWNDHLQAVRDIEHKPLQAALKQYQSAINVAESDFYEDLAAGDEVMESQIEKIQNELLTSVSDLLETMQIDHQNFVRQEIEELVAHLPDTPSRPAQAQKLRDAGEALIQNHQSAFDIGGISLEHARTYTSKQGTAGDPYLFSQEMHLQLLAHLATAHTQSRDTLLNLRDEFIGKPTQSIPLQVTSFKDSTSQTEKISLIQAAPALRNLVLAGGGMKAVGVSAALLTFNQAGQFEGVQNIVGNSAGSLTGMVLACGFDMDTLADFNAAVTNKDVVTGPEIDPTTPFAERYPSISFKTNGAMDRAAGLVHYFKPEYQTDAPRLLVELDRKTAQSVDQVLKSPQGQLAIEAVQKNITQGTSNVSAAELEQVLRLREPKFDGSNREPQMVTFKDLDILHRIDPVHFKTLSIVGFRQNEGDMQTFSAKLTPDMPIVYAGRISMAAPVVFTAPVYKGVVYRDGGLGNNFPTDVVHRGKSGPALDQSHAETMLFAYEAFKEAERNLFKHNEDKTSAPVAPGWGAWAMNRLEWAAKRQAGLKNFNEANLGDSNRVWNSGPQTTVVYHGDVNFKDFGASQTRKDFAVAQSRLMAQEQVALREQLAYNTVFEDPFKAAQAIPAHQRQAVLDSLPNNSVLASALRVELTRLLNQAEAAVN